MHQREFLIRPLIYKQLMRNGKRPPSGTWLIYRIDFTPSGGESGLIPSLKFLKTLRANIWQFQPGHSFWLSAAGLYEFKKRLQTLYGFVIFVSKRLRSRS
jgi:hypothetical protein